MKRAKINIILLLCILLIVSCGKNKNQIKIIEEYKTDCPEIQKLKVSFYNGENRIIEPHFFIQTKSSQPGYWKIISVIKKISPNTEVTFIIKSPYDEYGIFPGEEGVISVRDKGFEFFSKFIAKEKELPAVFNPGFSYYIYKKSRYLLEPMHWIVNKKNMEDKACSVLKNKKTGNVFYKIKFQGEKPRIVLRQYIKYLKKDIVMIFKSNISTYNTNNRIFLRIRTKEKIIDYHIKDILKKIKSNKRNQSHKIIYLNYKKNRFQRIIIHPYKLLFDSCDKVWIELVIIRKEKDINNYFILDKINYID